jgi:hypothetical protein
MASILNIAPEELPVHQITVVGVATATDTALVSEFGVQVESTISDYLSKDRSVDLPITLFHPTKSRFMNQTTTIKRGLSIFFSGALTVIEDKVYLELHNFSFIRTQTFTPPAKQMPWSLKLSTQSSTNSISTLNIAQSIHSHNKKLKNSKNSDNPFVLKLDMIDNPTVTQDLDTRKSDNPTSPT